MVDVALLGVPHDENHPDIYDSYDDNPRSHTSPFARIMEEGLVDRLVQVGLRTVNDHHRDQFRRFGVETVEMGRWDEARDLVATLATPVYVSLDLDGLDPAFAPGVSHREPGGPSPRQVIDLLHRVDQPLVGADVVELNPRCDIDGQTTLVAAKLVKELAGLMLRNAPATDAAPATEPAGD